MIPAKNLSHEAPSSPRTKVGGYSILARMADKGRADIAGTLGDFHFDCPLDNMLFDFKGVTGDEVKQLIINGATNDEIASWLNENGQPKTGEEKNVWCNMVEAIRPYDNPEKKDWFIGVCKEAGCNPATSTLFDFLEADDKTIA